ncbi:unnamed protein product [Amoebophrya sp. A120]|nr:unnamed protein product [Amoebophrya sp. A120]|eukprot:GSA120T00018090001.1
MLSSWRIKIFGIVLIMMNQFHTCPSSSPLFTKQSHFPHHWNSHLTAQYGPSTPSEILRMEGQDDRDATSRNPKKMRLFCEVHEYADTRDPKSDQTNKRIPISNQSGQGMMTKNREMTI